MSLVIGLMSGTSLDGVDAALVDFSSATPNTLHTLWLPFPQDIKRDVLGLQASGPDELNRSALLANRLAHCYAKASLRLLAEAGIDKSTVAAIGCHGQTVRHQPGRGYSIQLNNPSLLAELTELTVVADFRSRDIAAGGQGAPLVPAFHSAVFGSPGEHRVVLNIGGIANLTDLNPGLPVRGFDCGPGNILLDAWVARVRGMEFDADGEWAGSGRVIPRLLASLLDDPYFEAVPPKSCGRDEFNLAWLDGRMLGDEDPGDVQATLLELTAVTIANAIRKWCGTPTRLWICGGGVKNLALLDRLRALCRPIQIDKTDIAGQPADWVEAVAFAWLAWRTLAGETGSLAEVTGAQGPRILGAIYPE